MARNFITGNSFNFNYQLQTISNEWKIIQTIGFQGTVIAENDVREDPEGEGFRKKKIDIVLDAGNIVLIRVFLNSNYLM